MLWLKRSEKKRILLFMGLTWEAAIRGAHRWSPIRRFTQLFQAFQSLSPVIFCVLMFTAPFSAPLAIAGIVYGTCILSWLGVGIYLHRGLTHRGLKIRSRPLLFVLKTFTILSFQEHPLVWAFYHRRHHQTADTPEDPHSPMHASLVWIFGFFRLYVNWVSPDDFRRYQASFPEELAGKTIEDFQKSLASYAALTVAVHAAVFIALFSLGGWQAVVYLQILPILAQQVEMFAFINFASHLYGSRRFELPDGDRARNHLLAGIFSSEWHNNHHRFPSSSRTGISSWEIDPIYWAISVFEGRGWITDVIVPREIRELVAQRRSEGSGSRR
jgi:stearoyl-CoA desaturase (delta-9 desaturase)